MLRTRAASVKIARSISSGNSVGDIIVSLLKAIAVEYRAGNGGESEEQAEAHGP